MLEQPVNDVLAGHTISFPLELNGVGFFIVMVCKQGLVLPPLSIAVNVLYILPILQLFISKFSDSSTDTSQLSYAHPSCPTTPWL